MKFHVGCFVGNFGICMTQATAIGKRTVLPLYNNSTVSNEPSYGNAALGSQCWQQWTDYWNSSAKLNTMLTTFATQTTLTGWTDLVKGSYTTVVVTTTITKGNGNFPTTTYVTTSPLEKPVFTTVTSVKPETWTITDGASNTITAPPCTLPTYVRQCQSSWEDWISDGALMNSAVKPPCTQAFVSGDLCTTVLSSWISRERATRGEVDGKVGMQYTAIKSNGTTVTASYYWPTSSTPAPGCTIGCQACKVSGSRVKLLFWPPATTTWHNGTFAASATSNSTSMTTMITDGTTLTSPTIYISFDKLYASNSCSVKGTTLHDIIVPITNSATLSSLWGWDRYHGLQYTTSFNFTDLYVSPVPDSIYASQPRCASSSTSIQYSCLPLSDPPPICIEVFSGFACAKTLPYEPVIAIPKEVQQLQPDWADCVGGVLGVYDPPLALQAATTVVKPTAPIAPSINAGTTSIAIMVSATPATPASSIVGVATSTQTPSPSQISPSGSPAASNSGTHSTTENAEPAETSSGDPEHPSEPLENQSLGVAIGNNADSSSSTNALDVLTQALTISSPDVSGSASFDYDPVTSVILSVEEPPGTVVQIGDSIIRIGRSTTAVIQPGQTTVIDGRTLALGSEGGFFLGSTTIPMASSATGPASLTSTALVLTAGGDTYTVEHESEGRVIQINGGQATVLSGATTTIDGHAFAANDEGRIILDGTSYTVPQPVSEVGDQPGATWTNAGETYHAAADPSGMVLAGASATTTLQIGAAASYAGQSISVLAGSAIIIDGSMITLVAEDDAYSSSSATAGFNSGSEVVLPLPGTTLIISDGSQTIVEGITYSAAGGGDAVVAHGNGTTRTIDIIRSSTQSLPRVVAAIPTSSRIFSPTPVNGSPGLSSTASSSAARFSNQARRWLGALLFMLACVRM